MNIKPRLCLSMIVRDEAAVIERCLASVLPHIDAWAIVDTGSTDGTQDIVRRALAGLPGTLHEAPWTDFATARNDALDRAALHGEYALVIDADDVLVADPVPVPDLTADAYWLDIDYGGMRYSRPQVVLCAAGWRWRGVLHEFLDRPGAATPSSDAALPWRILVEGDGARSRDPLKYLHDADALAKALETETDRGLRNRYCFYLAQSYRDARHAGAAIYWYDVAFKAGGWSEERYVAALNLGRLTGDREWFVRAAAINPDRAEAWRALGSDGVADRCRMEAGWLFVERNAYRPGPPPTSDHLYYPFAA